MVKWFAGLAMLFLIMTIASNIIEGAYFGGSSAQTLWGSMDATDPASMIGGISKMLIFDYAFFTGFWVIFRYLFLCISIGIFVGMLMQMPLWLVVAAGVVGVGVVIGLYA